MSIFQFRRFLSNPQYTCRNCQRIRLSSSSATLNWPNTESDTQAKPAQNNPDSHQSNSNQPKHFYNNLLRLPADLPKLQARKYFDEERDEKWFNRDFYKYNPNKVAKNHLDLTLASLANKPDNTTQKNDESLLNTTVNEKKPNNDILQQQQQRHQPDSKATPDPSINLSVPIDLSEIYIDLDSAVRQLESSGLDESKSQAVVKACNSIVAQAVDKLRQEYSHPAMLNYIERFQTGQWQDLHSEFRLSGYNDKTQIEIAAHMRGQEIHFLEDELRDAVAETQGACSTVIRDFSEENKQRERGLKRKIAKAENTLKIEFGDMRAVLENSTWKFSAASAIYPATVIALLFIATSW